MNMNDMKNIKYIPKSRNFRNKTIILYHNTTRAKLLTCNMQKHYS